MDPEIFLAYFEQITHNTSENDLVDALKKYFSKFKNKTEDEVLNEFYEAVLANPSLANRANHPFLASLWDLILETQFSLKTQFNISSFYLIMGIYCFSKNKIEEGIHYQSYHCVCHKLAHLKDEYVNKPSWQHSKDILNLIQKTEYKHLTPDYLLYAKTCLELSNNDPRLLESGLLALYIAKKLEIFSANELYNATFGRKLTINGISDIAEMIKSYIYLIKKNNPTFHAEALEKKADKHALKIGNQLLGTDYLTISEMNEAYQKSAIFSSNAEIQTEQSIMGNLSNY